LQALLTHFCPAPQALPQAPQLLESELTLVHAGAAAEPQLVWPVAHVPDATQEPPEQTSGAAQTLPHMPQLFESVLRLVQTAVPVAGEVHAV
jgi:hypothetical protein